MSIWPCVTCPETSVFVKIPSGVWGHHKLYYHSPTFSSSKTSITSLVIFDIVTTTTSLGMLSTRSPSSVNPFCVVLIPQFIGFNNDFTVLEQESESGIFDPPTLGCRSWSHMRWLLVFYAPMIRGAQLLTPKRNPQSISPLCSNSRPSPIPWFTLLNKIVDCLP